QAHRRDQAEAATGGELGGAGDRLRAAAAHAKPTPDKRAGHWRGATLRSHMKTFIAFILTILIAAAVGFWIGQRHAGEKGDAEAEHPSAEEDKPVAQVTVTPLRRATIDQTITAYGSVVAPGGKV